MDFCHPRIGNGASETVNTGGGKNDRDFDHANNHDHFFAKVF
jgi:hypothetical protein